VSAPLARSPARPRAGDLRIIHLEDLTAHYARTLERWAARFRANRRTIDALGYPEELLRSFEFYFAYCAAGFLERRTSCAQLVLAMPANRRAPILGELGA
jgi:cyclopropane-fatty-acyl-phospholipid synthase